MFSNEYNINESFRAVKATFCNDATVIEAQDIRSIKVNGKTAIILSGNNTKDENRAGYYTRVYFNWLKSYSTKENITAYAIYYPKEQPLFTNLTINPVLDYKKLAFAIFSPILFNEDKPREIKDIVSTFSDITFIGHSAGGFVMNELMNNLDTMLDDMKFSKSEKETIFSRIVFIGYSPFKLVEKPIKNVIVAPVFDSLGSTKLVFDKMQESKGFKLSNKALKIYDIFTLRSFAPQDYAGAFTEKTDNSDTLYARNENFLIATPNLLYSDEFNEDHNLTGVINFPFKNNNKTIAGDLTSDLLHDTVCYCLEKNRAEFSTKELFTQAIKNAKNFKQPTLEE